MTDDEFTIKEPRIPSAREIRNALYKEKLREERRVSGITDEVLKASTAGGAIVALQLGEANARRLFDMTLPGVPEEEQRKLLDQFESILHRRKQQIITAVRYIDAHYDIVEKGEADE